MKRDLGRDMAAGPEAEAFEELRSLVRHLDTSSEELRHLRDEAANERAEAQQRVLETIAGLRGVETEEVARATCINAERLFAIG